MEKIFLDKLLPYLSSDDSQFGYKKHHGTFHAIEIVQVSEESDDAHICLLDASSAFDIKLVTYRYQRATYINDYIISYAINL